MRKQTKQILTTPKYIGVIKSGPKETVSMHNLSRSGYEAMQRRSTELGYMFDIDIRGGIFDPLITMHVLTIHLYKS